ncbi:hypothetical protein OIU84_007906 [Salix udensis]|uniref:Uncharacterized protein n=1 Tax=Salix udensis TaxID=889485 RepID=A0AAD6JU65_9ROSI|nr:hypothetical protein OIU84_007906 [Salix udensis]
MAQSSSLTANVPAATLFVPASGVSTAPPPGFFVSSMAAAPLPYALSSLGCNFPPEMATLPPSAPTVSALSGFPSSALLVPNPHLHVNSWVWFSARFP